ncbi:hypothetical protein Tco_0975928 [Tanacetum coccineum]|uniref:Uncharacterized protein n=1 Tax=Tanacetum coccineum TaxID=301880 RepID=A0ABQ5EFT6_9ASTR
MNYQPVRSKIKANKHGSSKEATLDVGIEDNIDAGNSKIEAESAQDYFVLPIWSSYTSTDANDAVEALRKEFAQDTEDLLLQAGAAKASSTNTVNTASTPVSIASPYGGLSFTDLTNTDQDDSEIPALEDIYDNPTAGIFTNASYDDEGVVADFTNLETIVNVSPIPTSRINSIHPSTLILGDPNSAVQTRSKVTKSSGAHAFSLLLTWIHSLSDPDDVKSVSLYGKIDGRDLWWKNKDFMLWYVHIPVHVGRIDIARGNNKQRRRLEVISTESSGVIDIPERLQSMWLSSKITQTHNGSSNRMRGSITIVIRLPRICEGSDED